MTTTEATCGCYTPRVDAILDTLSDFSEHDFAQLALACIDQDGESLAVQSRVRAMLVTLLDVDLPDESLDL